MAEEQPSLQIDTDWKKQAQEEKRKLAEKAQQAKAGAPAGGAGSGAAATPSARRGERETPPASFSTLVQQMLTQAMFYLGELAYRGQPPMMDLDMARHQHDLLTMLEEKTANNLNEEERRLMDMALHEVRTRFIRTASEYISF
jgi:predicted exporter